MASAMNGDLLGWIPVLIHWVIGLDKPLARGLVLLASLLAALGYLLMRVGWRYWCYAPFVGGQSTERSIRQIMHSALHAYQ